MASINQKLQPSQFPAMSFDFPSPDNSLAKAINTATEIVSDVRLGNAEKALTGEDKPYTKDELASAALNEKELNLRKIKRMREQGLVSASGAKVMANQAVQSASARLPGRAAEFRKMTAAFFGDFGEGQDLLEQTDKEKKQGELEFALKKAAALKGYGQFDQNGRLIQNSDDVNNYLAVVRGTFHNEAEMSNLSLAFEQGKATTSTAVQLANRQGRKFMLEFMGDVNGKLSHDGVLYKPAELIARLSTAQQSAEAAMDKFLNDPSRAGIITPQMRTSARSELQGQFKTMQDFVTSQAFSKVMQENRQGIQDLFKIYSYNALPNLAIAREAGGDNAVKFFTEYAPKFANMNENQRNALLAHDPAARMAWNTAIAADRIHRSYSNVIKGFLPASSMDRVVTQDAAAWNMTQPVENPQDQEAKSKAFDILRQSANEGETEKLAVLTFPETSKNSTAQDQEQVLSLLANEWAAHQTTTAQLLAPDAHGIRKQQRIIFDTNKGQYVLAYTPKGAKLAGIAPTAKINGEDVAVIDTRAHQPLLGRPGTPNELVRVVQDMNQSIKIMRNFNGTAKFQKEFAGISVDQFAQLQLDQINAPRQKAEAALDAPLDREDVDNLLIDVRLGGGREKAARRLLESKGINVDAMLKANEKAASNTTVKPSGNE